MTTEPQNTEAHRPGSLDDIREAVSRARTLAENATRLALSGSDPVAHATASSAWSAYAGAAMSAELYGVPRFITGHAPEAAHAGDVTLADAVTGRPR